jgi:murein L,D-transpeptidase YcbB/YkuD
VNGKKSTVISPYSINWNSGNLRNLAFKQPPGERNALGRIKFMFPNEHAVYLHDTPSRSLFAVSMRAMSHGCVRVHEPLAFGEALLGAQGVTAKRLAGLIGGAEKRVNVAPTIPVHLAYFTETVDASGALKSFKDVYGHDKLIKAALGLDGIATAAN